MNLNILKKKGELSDEGQTFDLASAARGEKKEVTTFVKKGLINCGGGAYDGDG